MIVAVAGTLNPSSGDVSVFLPTEQAALAHTVAGPARTKAFAWYNVVGSLAASVGALASGLPAWTASHWGVALLRAERGVFVFYAACAVAVGASSTRGCHPRWRSIPTSARRAPLAESRAIVLRLAALFSVDSFGGGFVVQSLLVLWLHRRFHLDARTTAGGVLRRRRAQPRSRRSSRRGSPPASA